MKDRIVIPTIDVELQRGVSAKVLGADAARVLIERLAAADQRIVALERRTGRPGIVTSDVTAKPGEFLNIEAGADGLTIILPQATQALRNARVTLAFRNANPVRVVAVGSTVNREAFVINEAVGTYDAICDGLGGWSVSILATPEGIALPPTSPGGAALSAEYVLGAAHASLPNGRVATDSTEIDVDLGTPGVASWALRTASVVFGKLQDLTGLSVLGRAANSAGVMAAITATAARQTLRVNDAGSALEWGHPVEVRESGADEGDVYALDFVDGTDVSLAVSVASGVATITPSVDLSSVTYTAGDGLDLSSNTLSVDVSDLAGTGVEDDGSNNLRIASSAAGDGLIGGSGSALAVGAGTKITVNANDVAWTGADARDNGGSLLGSTVREFQGQDSSTINELFAVVGSSLALAYEVNEAADFDWTGTHTFAEAVHLGSAFTSALSTGNNNDINIGANSAASFTAAAGAIITGIVPLGDGHMLWLENADTTDTISIAHDSTSTAANRFYLPLGNDLTIVARAGMWFRYNGTLQRWVVASGRPFVGINVRNSPTLHTGISTIDVIAGDGLDVVTSTSGAAPGVEVDVTYDLSDVSANQILCNASGSSGNPFANRLSVGANAFPARVGGNLVSHSFSTLAGAGLTYSSGVLDVSTQANQHITVLPSDEVAFRKSRRKDVWWEEFTYCGGLSGGVTITTSGFEASGQTTTWWVDAVANSGSLTPLTLTGQHPGIWRLTTGNTSLDEMLMHNGTAQTLGFEMYRGDVLGALEGIFRLPTVSNVQFEFGLRDQAGDNYIEFYFDTAVDTTIRAYTESANVATDTDTNVTWNAGNWNVLRMEQSTTGTVLFYIDDNLVATHTTNVPTSAPMGVFVRLRTRTNATRSADVDYIMFESRDIGARTS